MFRKMLILDKFLWKKRQSSELETVFGKYAIIERKKAEEDDGFDENSSGRF